jgi:hypothetical protein
MTENTIEIEAIRLDCYERLAHLFSELGFSNPDSLAENTAMQKYGSALHRLSPTTQDIVSFSKRPLWNRVRVFQASGQYPVIGKSPPLNRVYGNRHTGMPVEQHLRMTSAVRLHALVGESV